MGDYQFGKVKMPVEPDATGFGKKLSAEVKVQSEGVEAKVDVVPDMTGFNAALRRKLKETMKEAGVSVSVPVELKIDRAQLKTDLRFIQAQVNTQNVKLELGITIPKAALQAEIRRIREVIKAERDIEIPLKPVVLRKDIQAAIRDLKAFARAEGAELPLRPTLNANKGAFVAEVRAFIAEIQRSIPDLHIGVKADTGSAIATKAALSRSLGDGKDINHIDDKLKNLAKTAGAITGPLGGVGSQFARLTQSGSLLAAGIGGLGVAFAGIIGYGTKIAADAQLADKGIVALTKSLGFSADASAQYIKQLERFAAVTPFEVPQVKEATKFLLGAGTAAEDVLPLLTRITDVGSVLGSTTENIENVAKALAKVRGKGTAQLLELNQIRRNLPGFDPVKAIADFKGQTLAQTYTDISRKAIPASLAIEAINQGLENFPGAAGAAAAAAETLTGRFSTLKDNIALGFKDAFLQPEVEKPLNDLLKNLAENAQSQIAEGAKSLAPIITAFGPALQSGVTLFLELTKASSPFFVKLLEGAKIFTDRLTPAVKDLSPLFKGLGDLLITLAPALASILGLIGSGASSFGLLATGLRVVAPLLNGVADAIESLPAPLRSVIGLVLIFNRQKIFSSITDAGPKAIEILKTIAKILAGLVQGGFENLAAKLRKVADGATTVGTAGTKGFTAMATAATTAATASAAAAASVKATSTALATIDLNSFQTARIRGQGALGSGSGLSLVDDVIDVRSIEKVKELSSGAVKAVGEIGPATEASVGRASKAAAGLADGLLKVGSGASKAFAALSGPVGAAAAVGIGLIAQQWLRVRERTAEAKEAGLDFSKQIFGALNDPSKAQFSLADQYLTNLSDRETKLGAIFNNQEFTDALKARGESISDYAQKLSGDSLSAIKSFEALAKEADRQRGYFSGLGGGFGSNNTEDGRAFLQQQGKTYLEALADVSGPGADEVKRVLAKTQKDLIAEGSYQYKTATVTLTNDTAKRYKEQGLILDDYGQKVEAGAQVLVAVKTDQADYNLAIQRTNMELIRLGYSVDPLTKKVTLLDESTRSLALGLGTDNVEAVAALQKQIDTLNGSLGGLFDSIKGADVLGGPNGLTAQLGGASLAVIQFAQDGEVSEAELLSLTNQLGLSGDAATEFANKALGFGDLYLKEIAKTQEAFKGLVPSVSQVFEDLKGTADGVVPKFDQVLKELEARLDSSAQVNDNLGKIIARGGSGLIETLSSLPAEAQAAYASAIAQANDKTFVTLEAKARELNEEGRTQIQNQGLLSIATVQTTVNETLKPIAVAQKALEDKAAEVRGKLRGEAQQAGLNPQQRRLLRDDRDQTTAASVASTGAELAASVAGVTDDINTSLATVPLAAKKATDDAVQGLSGLPQQITSATVPGLQTWSYDVATTTDTAANAFGNLAIRGVDAMQRLANGIETPAQRIVEVVGAMADAINSVSAQVGSADRIVVPGIPKKYIGARTNKVEIKHSGGVVGDGVSSARTNGPVASNEQLVLAQKGEGVIPADAMKRLGLAQFKFIQQGDITGLLAAKGKVPDAKSNVAGANDIAHSVAGSFGPALGGIMETAVGNLAKNVTKYLDEVSTLIDSKIGVTPGLIPGGNIGGAGSAAAAVWIRTAMAIAGAPDSWFTGLMTLAKRESGFNPRSINLWDSNAKKGTPSIGLMQTIGPTFRAYALPGYTDIYNPVHNAIASIRYIRARYGDISKVQQANPNKPPKGYSYGDLITTEQTARIGEGNVPELILPIKGNPRRAEDLLAKYIFDPTVSGVDSNRLIARLEAAIGKNAAPEKRVVVGDGGSLIKLEMQGESLEALEAQITSRAAPLVRQLLS